MVVEKQQNTQASSKGENSYQTYIVPPNAAVIRDDGYSYPQGGNHGYYGGDGYPNAPGNIAPGSGVPGNVPVNPSIPSYQHGYPGYPNNAGYHNGAVYGPAIISETCSFHPNVEAKSKCLKCEKLLCLRCTQFVSEKVGSRSYTERPYCRDCKVTLINTRALLATFSLLFGLGIGISVLVFVFVRLI